MRVYHERLRVPVSWWLVGLVAIVLLGTELVAGFGLLIAALIYLVLGGFYAAMLLNWGRATVVVEGPELFAGGSRLPLAHVGEVTPLDESQTRVLRGPRADPAAMMLMRPYLRHAVFVEVSGPDQTAPYWLVGTRHPADLAAAIDRARPAARAGGTSVG